MQTKLTLSMDDKVIMIAKKYALRKNRSVSKIVEDYFSNLDKVDSELLPFNQGQITESIAGMFKEEYDGSEYQDLLEQALMEKYL